MSSSLGKLIKKYRKSYRLSLLGLITSLIFITVGGLTIAIGSSPVSLGLGYLCFGLFIGALALILYKEIELIDFYEYGLIPLG